jgi:hypothetical protein
MGRYFKCNNPAFTIIPYANAWTHSTGANEYLLRLDNGGGGVPNVSAAYFLNNAPAPEPVLPSNSRVVDYTMIISVRGGSTVTLEANSIDQLEWSNISGLTVNGGSPAIRVVEPYRLNVGHGGQWLQMDTVSIF